MKAMGQLTVAAFVALAVFTVFIYPLTFGPPAPQQKRSAVLAAVVSALTAAIALLRAAMRPTAVVELIPPPVNSPSERLSLICTRLC